eukprot:sb/3475125/
MTHLVPELGGVEKCQNGLKLQNCYIYAVGKRAHFFGKSFWGDGMGSPLRLPAQLVLFWGNAVVKLYAFCTYFIATPCAWIYLYRVEKYHANPAFLLGYGGPTGRRTLVLTDSLSKFKADSISKNGLFIYS